MSDKSTKTKSTLSDGRRAERRLELLLVAPALILMLAVPSYPIGYAIWLSLQRYDLRFPDVREFIGLQNYASALTGSYWWEALGVTACISPICFPTAPPR